MLDSNFNLEMQANTKDEYKAVTFFKNPLIIASTTIILIYEQLMKLLKFFLTHTPFMIITIILIFMSFFDGPHKEFFNQYISIFYFCLYWIALGVASSIGLGTGLHTFVLYLGPHIAKVTLAANECTYFPKMYPSKWEFKEFEPCSLPVTNQNPSVNFFIIFWNVILEAFLWGAGTAIGELPPYYMAKAAAEAGKSNQEIDEIREIEKSDNKSLMDNLKAFLYQHLKKHGFITVFLCASIPNPLFDLAGITCGHFGIRFSTFFGATFIGKACIKATLQTLFVILTFSKHHIETVLKFLERIFPILGESLMNSLEKQKKLLWHSENSNLAEENKPLIATLWEIFITGMILYFLKSIIESLVNDKRKKEYDAKEKNK